jgi:hypothetical protein
VVISLALRCPQIRAEAFGGKEKASTIGRSEPVLDATDADVELTIIYAEEP